MFNRTKSYTYLKTRQEREEEVIVERKIRRYTATFGFLLTSLTTTNFTDKKNNKKKLLTPMSIRKESLFMGYLRLPVLNSCQYSPLWGNSFSVILIYNKKIFFQNLKKKKIYFWSSDIGIISTSKPPNKMWCQDFSTYFSGPVQRLEPEF